MAVYEVGGQAVLRATYVDDTGTPADPTSVTLDVRDPTGLVTTRTPLREGVGVYSYLLALTAGGLWKWRFTAPGVGSGSQSGSLRASDAFASGVGDYVTIDEIQTALGGRVLTPAEADRARQLITSVTTTLEGWLRRDLISRSYTNERHLITPAGNLIPFRAAVIPGSLVVKTVDGYPQDPLIAPVRWWEPVWSPRSVVEIDYTTRDDDRAQGVVLDAVSATLSVFSAAGVGAIASYAVEGTSITYGPVATTDTSTGRVPVGSIRGISYLRVPNIRP